MSCCVVLTAGGIGSRIGSDIPKQFIHVNDKPVIVYMMEAFQRHLSADGIVVACLEGREKLLRAYCSIYGDYIQLPPEKKHINHEMKAWRVDGC